jgi:hypothetical protein
MDITVLSSLYREGDSNPGTGRPADGSCEDAADICVKNPGAGSLQGEIDRLSQGSGAGRWFGFRRRALDTTSSGFYIPATFSGGVKQHGEVAEHRQTKSGILFLTRSES